LNTLAFPFFLALFVALFRTAFLPHLHLMAFAPFLAIVYQRKRFAASLWYALISGFIIDLFTSEFRLGIFALNYLLTTLLVYRQKRYFFGDKSLSLFLFTALISSVSSTLQLLLFTLFAKKVELSGKLIVCDLILMPLLDAVYAFLWFTCPMKLYTHLQKRGWRSILFKEK
jgi:rod shape-determining protein MreD